MEQFCDVGVYNSEHSTVVEFDREILQATRMGNQMVTSEPFSEGNYLILCKNVSIPFD